MARNGRLCLLENWICLCVIHIFFLHLSVWVLTSNERVQEIESCITDGYLNIFRCSHLDQEVKLWLLGCESLGAVLEACCSQEEDLCVFG